jgi:hypothetical protein
MSGYCAVTQNRCHSYVVNLLCAAVGVSFVDICVCVECAADIRRGQGMVLDSAAMSATGMLTFRAVTCTRNNYGTSSLKKRGLAKSSCKVNTQHSMLFCVAVCTA